MNEQEFLRPCQLALTIYQKSPYGDMWQKMSYHELASIAAYKARRATVLEPDNPKIEDDILDALNFLIFAYLQRSIPGERVVTETQPDMIDAGYLPVEPVQLETMRTFTMLRKGNLSTTHGCNQVNPPDEAQFEGVIFSDGKCAIRWLTLKRSISVWDSFEDMMAIHGHPEYESELVWHDSQYRRII